jgi:SAM-dependent methyltransferase
MEHAYDLEPAFRSARRSTASETGTETSQSQCARDDGRTLSLQTASAYDHVGDEYARYADGVASSGGTQSWAGRYQHGDAIVWSHVCKALDELRASGKEYIRVLDAGCGPGVWSRRIVDYASRIGCEITLIGVDISAAQIAIAQRDTATACEFRQCDLSKPLPWPDKAFDLALCNYTVLNHLAEAALPAAIAELCRVSAGKLIATLRAVGSAPTACIIGMEHVREYHHDNIGGELRVTLDDGSRHAIPFKIYSAERLRQIFARHA